MKKMVLTTLALVFVAAGVSGCAKEEPPVQNESTMTAQIPVPETVREATMKTGVAIPILQEEVKNLPAEQKVSEGVNSSVQSSTQTLVREGSAIVGGVTSAVQSSNQTLARDGSAIVSGVTAAAQSATQVAVREEGPLAEKAEAAKGPAVS